MTESLAKIGQAIENAQALKHLEDASAESKEKLNAGSVTRLLRLLRESDMEALDCFHKISEALKKKMSESDYIALEGFITHFRFEKSVKILERNQIDQQEDTMLSNERKPVVLVVDDTRDNILLLNELLKDQYRVRVATNGVKALEADCYSPPDIILMDIMMPVIDGYEACRRLKKDEKPRDISILFLTAKSDEEDEQKGFALGAADYITKSVCTYENTSST